MQKARESAKTAGVLLLLVATASLATCAKPLAPRAPVQQPPAPSLGWYLAWRGETVFPQQIANAQTCRFPAMLSGGGSELRAEFTSPAGIGNGYTVLDASIARSAGPGLDVQSSTVTALTFSGQPAVVVLPGSRVLSDPIAFPTTDASVLAVTVTVSAGQAPTTPNSVDIGACTPAPIAGADAAPGRLFSVPHHLMWLRSLQVYGPPRRSIAGFGDSITVTPQVPINNYWTDALLGHDAAVVNAGVGGGYLTTTGMYGTAVGLSRLDDLLTEPGLTDVVMLLGTNDLAVGVSPTNFLTAVANALRDAQTQHVRMWVCTILPRGDPWWAPSAEGARLSVNTVLRTSWLTDRGGHLIDTDAALRDPEVPTRLLPAYDAGDHVHPSPAGAHELGITIGLALGLLM